MGNAISLTNANFAQMTAGKVCLLDFYADWCGPCKMLAPVLDQIAEEYKDKLLTAKINVDTESALAAQFGVRSIPSIFILKNGESVAQFVGVQDKSKLIKAIDEALLP